MMDETSEKPKAPEVVKVILDELVKHGPLHGAWWNLSEDQRTRLRKRCRELAAEVLGE